MKVLQVNQTDIIGGAAIAAYRLHEGLRLKKVDSRLWVPVAAMDEETTSVVAPMSFAERIFFKLTNRVSPAHINLLRTWDIFKLKSYREADVIHFHNLHSGLFFNYLAIPRICREKPVVFTLHDMWSFTGHCSYSFDCEKWKNGCGHCPYPDVYPAIRWDYTAIEIRLKKRVYARSNMTIVTPSHWLGDLARQSILGRFPVVTIPNGIDTALYRPMDKAEARQVLGLPSNSVVLMFACEDLSTARKGMDLLMELLRALPGEIKAKVALYAMGREPVSLEETTGIRTFLAGYVKGDAEKARAYSAADLFISTSRADNLPLVLQESMACGTPLLAYEVGGLGDLVRHGVTGYMAPLGDVAGMRDRLVELIQNPGLRQAMSIQARQTAVDEYALGTVVDKYEALYADLIHHRRMTVSSKS